MKVIMIGALMCPTCNRIKPKIEEYCRDNNVVFNYYILGINTPRDILSIITAYHVKKFPTFIIYKDNEDIVVLTGDDIFLELEFLK